MDKSLQLKHAARAAESVPFSQQLDDIFVYQTLNAKKKLLSLEIHFCAQI